MGRSNFGGAQDISGVLAAIYGQYQNEQQVAARRADQAARDDQQAADQDMLNQWKDGAISDDEMLAYAKQRATDPNNEASDTTYWKNTVRDVAATVKQRNIQTGAQTIINGINNGTRSYDDLLKFYQSSLKGMKPNDPLFSDITGQINDLKKTISDNQIQGSLEKVQYQFESGQLTGAQAGSQIRALAARYQKSDPKTYYQILESALQMEKYGNARYGSGGGGGGGGGGSKSKTAAINASIDGLQALRDIINNASEQFDKGGSTATVGIPQPDGTIKYQTIQVRNPDGTPTADMQALDNQMLGTYDQLAKAQIAKKDYSAAASTIAAKSKYITGEIQPRNTIGPEQQLAHLYGSLQDAVAGAANGIDPKGQWWTVQSVADAIQTWNNNLNAHTEYGKAPSEKQAAANPELNAASRKYGVANAPEASTTSDFAGKAKALANLADLLSHPDPKNADAIQTALKVVFGGVDPTNDSFKKAGAIFLGGNDTISGVVSGRYALTFTNKDGYAWRPIQPVPIGPGPDGTPRVNYVPVDPQTGKPIFDPSKGETLATSAIDVGGMAVPVFAAATTVNTYGGKIVNSLAGLNSQQKSSVQTLPMVTLPDPTTGQPHYWFQTGQGWVRDSLTGAAPAPMPYEGSDLRGAQRIANTTSKVVGDPTSGPLDASGNYFIKNAAEDTFGTQDNRPFWYQQAQQNAIDLSNQQAKNRIVGSLPGQQQQQGLPVAAELMRAAKALGLGTLEDVGSSPSRTALPPVAQAAPVLPKLNLPKPPPVPRPSSKTAAANPELNAASQYVAPKLNLPPPPLPPRPASTPNYSGKANQYL